MTLSEDKLDLLLKKVTAIQVNQLKLTTKVDSLHTECDRRRASITGLTMNATTTTSVAIDLDSMREDLQRRMRRLEELFPTKPVVSATPSATPSSALSSSAFPTPPTSPPTPTPTTPTPTPSSTPPSTTPISTDATNLCNTTTVEPLQVSPARCSTPSLNHDIKCSEEWIFTTSPIKCSMQGHNDFNYMFNTSTCRTSKVCSCGYVDVPLRQPWPPPVLFEMQNHGVQVRPTPWPGFSCAAVRGMQTKEALFRLLDCSKSYYGCLVVCQIRVGEVPCQVFSANDSESWYLLAAHVTTELQYASLIKKNGVTVFVLVSQCIGDMAIHQLQQSPALTGVKFLLFSNQLKSSLSQATGMFAVRKLSLSRSDFLTCFPDQSTGHKKFYTKFQTTQPPLLCKVLLFQWQVISFFWDQWPPFSRYLIIVINGWKGTSTCGVDAAPFSKCKWQVTTAATADKFSFSSCSADMVLAMELILECRVAVSIHCLMCISMTSFYLLGSMGIWQTVAVHLKWRTKNTKPRLYDNVTLDPSNCAILLLLDSWEIQRKKKFLVLAAATTNIMQYAVGNFSSMQYLRLLCWLLTNYGGETCNHWHEIIEIEEQRTS